MERCKASVSGQSLANEIVHIIVEDTVGVGIGGMFEEFGRRVGELQGQYIYILQDDDILAGNEAAARVQRFAKAEGWPEVIICRNLKRGCIYPTYWNAEPRLMHIDLGNYVVRADVMRENAWRFGKRYEGDFDFIHALWEQGQRFAWLEMLISREQLSQPGLGRSEDELRKEGAL